jgi:hypothetical protein
VAEGRKPQTFRALETGEGTEVVRASQSLILQQDRLLE